MKDKAQVVISRLPNLVLLLLLTVTTFVCFFATMELLLTVAAWLIYHGIESSFRQRYALITVRNVWLIGGGALLVGLTIGFFSYFSKRLDHGRTRKRILLILLVEIAIIATSWVVAG